MGLNIRRAIEARNLTNKEVAARLDISKTTMQTFLSPGATPSLSTLNRIAAIPSIDIIDYRPAQRPGFCPTWHTLDDTPQNIDPLTLKAVGQTLLQLIYTF